MAGLMRWLSLLVLGLAAPAAALAQAPSCNVPAILPRPHADEATEKEPRRVMPIGGYTLALSWSPEFCHGHRSDTVQCGARSKFGFVLHGLWPDGNGKTWPQYCRPVALLPEAVIRENICATPSPQLLQHEYAKHGSCTGLAPDRYFAMAKGLYEVIRYPDMASLAAQRGVSTGAFAKAFAAANPGMTPEMIQVKANRRGWLEDIWICLDKTLKQSRCPVHDGSAQASARIRIAAP